MSGQEIEKQFRKPKQGQNQQFYYRSDIVYTMPGKGGEMAVWKREGKNFESTI